MQPDLLTGPLLQWDWDIEHQDRKREARADAAIHGAQPFQVDRKLLKDIVHEKMGVEVVRIMFLGAGTFHKGYRIILADEREVVARVARRFMPRLKTDSEVATMKYLRERTDIPVPTIYHHDSNPYNRLGGEYIIMSKAPGIPLARVFHSMGYNELSVLMENLANLIIPLFAHRFARIGSLYLGPDPNPVSDETSTMPTPTANHHVPNPLSLSMTPVEGRFAKSERFPFPAAPPPPPTSEFHVGPIISWPFFGSNRGEMTHPDEINRGPWPSTYSYLLSCVQREIDGVIRENEGKSAPHRLHLDPDEILSSRHHQLRAVPGDESDNSDEWDMQESEEEWEGPGDSMYRDYRRMQRSTFLVAHLKERENRVQAEMSRVVRMMERLGVMRREDGADTGGGGGTHEEFTLDCHDLSLENVFVDENDNTKISCIIDWESTTTRPLWACAHTPTFLQSSPFTAKLFRAVVEKMASDKKREIVVNGQSRVLATAATEWLHHEATGVRLRMVHRCLEWDGWEEGLAESILGPEDQEDDWFKSWDEVNGDADGYDSPLSPGACTSPTLTDSEFDSEGSAGGAGSGGATGLKHVPVKAKGRVSDTRAAKVVAVEKEKEKLLKATGDICGGRGGELGRRLEAWLLIHGDAELARRWGSHEDVLVA